VHASYPKDALSRLETMALMSGVELPLAALKSQLTSAVDIIVQTDRFRDGSRGITHITEVVGGESEDRKLIDLFARWKGRLISTGNIPACAEHLRNHGFDYSKPSRDSERAPKAEAS
jgi:pilus assembly protein CpaF